MTTPERRCPEVRDGGVVEVTGEQLQMGRVKETFLAGLSWRGAGNPELLGCLILCPVSRCLLISKR